MAAMPDDIRHEIESAYAQDAVKNPSSSTVQSPKKNLHPLMRPEVRFTHQVFWMMNMVNVRWLCIGLWLGISVIHTRKRKHFVLMSFSR